MNVTFHAPIIGKSSVPLGLDGPGEALWSPEGITMRGMRHNPHIGSLFGFLGFALGMIAAASSVMLVRAVVGERYLKLGTGAAGILFISTFFSTLRMGRKMVKPKEVSFTVPWDKVRKLGIDDQTGMVSFDSKGRFRGRVQLVVDGMANEVLLDELKSSGSGNGLRV